MCRCLCSGSSLCELVAVFVGVCVLVGVVGVLVCCLCTFVFGVCVGVCLSVCLCRCLCSVFVVDVVSVLVFLF